MIIMMMIRCTLFFLLKRTIMIDLAILYFTLLYPTLLYSILLPLY